jgi:probable F420-dependent oxidoreductase
VIRLLLILTENNTMRPTPDVGNLVRFAQIAEESGIDGIMVSEHVVLGPAANASGQPANPRDYALPGNQDPATPWPSPIVLLSAIAAATTSLRLVAGALITPLRHPLALAKDLATLDRLSHGRLVVLPTVSWHKAEYDALGIPFHHRGALLDEQLEIWTKAWSGSPVSHDGNHYTFDQVWIEPQPVTPGGPALWFGGSTVHPRLVNRIVRHGKGFNPLGQPDEASLQRLAAAMKAAGRDPAELEYVGGTRGEFPSPDRPASLDQALATIPAQLARGFTTICIKPSQFIDSQSELPSFCKTVVRKVSQLG